MTSKPEIVWHTEYQYPRAEVRIAGRGILLLVDPILPLEQRKARLRSGLGLFRKADYFDPSVRWVWSVKDRDEHTEYVSDVKYDTADKAQHAAEEEFAEYAAEMLLETAQRLFRAADGILEAVGLLIEPPADAARRDGDAPSA